MNFIEKIQKILDERGITPYKMCKDIGIKQATYSAWKQKGTQPQIDKVILIVNYLELSLDELLELKKEEITEREKEILRAYKKAPASVQQGIDTLLEPYKENQRLSKSKIG